MNDSNDFNTDETQEADPVPQPSADEDVQNEAPADLGFDFDFGALFRRETLFTHVNRRIDVAAAYESMVLGDHEIELRSRREEFRGSLTQSFGMRDRSVDYLTRDCELHDTYMLTDLYRERFHGMHKHMAVFAAEAMVGGTYVNTITGFYMRLGAWIDFMAWGAWVEADTVRIEIAALMIRSYMGYAHAAMARVCVASRLIDDLLWRNEYFGVFIDNCTSYTYLSGPGGGLVMEA